MKKSIIPLLLLLASLTAATQASAAEDITLTSYYPTPYASHRQLSSTSSTYLATSGAASVGIGAPVSAGFPNSAALLDIVSTSSNKGLLIPRARAGNIASPLEGLMIVDTTNPAPALMYYSNTGWQTVGSSAPSSDYWVQTGNNIHNNFTQYLGKVHIGNTVPSYNVSGAKLLVQGGGTSAYSATRTGGTPVSGAGTRFMWVPAKAALRSGLVTASNPTSWDDVNIGPFSIATGEDCVARADSSIAMGSNNRVGVTTGTTGAQSVALGANIKIYSNGCVGIGSNLTFGSDAFIDTSAQASTAIGHNISVSNRNTFTLGSGPSDGSRLVNNMGSSLMIGLNRTTPAIYILSGQVGIGTTAPARLLDVNGDIFATGTFGPSDLRLKTDVTPLPEGTLEKIDKLQGFYFQWNELARARGFRADEKRHLGLLAQDVEKLFPTLVRPDGEFKAVDYSGLSTFLLQGVRELRAKTERLERKVLALEKK